MKTLLMAERMNLVRRGPGSMLALAWERPERWLDVSLVMGAYCVEYPVCHPSRRRLEGIGLGAFIEDDAHRLNLLPPAACGEWDRKLADHVASWLHVWAASREYTHVTVLGRRVVASLCDCRTQFFDHWEWDGIAYMSCPHPSGRSYFWNDAGEVERGRRAVSEWFAYEE